MKDKISIAIPAYVNVWLRKKAKKDGQSVSSLISHVLAKYVGEQHEAMKRMGRK